MCGVCDALWCGAVWCEVFGAAQCGAVWCGTVVCVVVQCAPLPLLGEAWCMRVEGGGVERGPVNFLRNREKCVGEEEDKVDGHSLGGKEESGER